MMFLIQFENSVVKLKMDEERINMFLLKSSFYQIANGPLLPSLL